MRKLSGLLLLSFLSWAGWAQPVQKEHTLLWKISGNGLEKPSYLYGTIHMICAEDALLSVNMKRAIRDCDEVYLEVDLSNIFEMVGALSRMKMRGDTTLRDLLTLEEYDRVKRYFEEKGSALPFTLLETYKPMLAASTLEQKALDCDRLAIMEQVIMEEARRKGKRIRGLETMAYQAGVLDSIPYQLQARQLLSYIDQAGTNNQDTRLLQELFLAYKRQDLDRLEQLMVEGDAGMSGFTDILLFHRNENWVRKLRQLLPGKSLVIAVGAGHLPGNKGVIRLLRQEGYVVEPVENLLVKSGEI